MQIRYRSKDELGSLAGNMRSMASTLSDVIADETHVLGEMAQGNFAVHASQRERYVGELEQILLSMREINRRLSRTMFQINQSADEVAAGSRTGIRGSPVHGAGSHRTGGLPSRNSPEPSTKFPARCTGTPRARRRQARKHSV